MTVEELIDRLRQLPAANMKKSLFIFQHPGVTDVRPLISFYIDPDSIVLVSEPPVGRGLAVEGSEYDD